MSVDINSKKQKYMLKKVSSQTRQVYQVQEAVHKVNRVRQEIEHNNPAKDFFLYLITFLSLAFIALGEISILFELINKFGPDQIEKTFSMFSQSSVSFGIASLIIAGPIFFILSRIIDQRINIKKIPIESKVRKWLTYIVLFLRRSQSLWI